MKSLKKKLKNSYYKLDERKTLYTKFSRSKFRKINHPRFLSPSLKKKKKEILPIPRKNLIKTLFPIESKTREWTKKGETAGQTWLRRPSEHGGQAMAKPRRPRYTRISASPLRRVYIGFEESAAFQRSRLVGISLGTTTNRHTRTSRASINTSLTSSRPVPCFVYGRVCLARIVKTVLPNNNECVGGWMGRIARRVPLSRVFLTQFRSSGSPLPLSSLSPPF